MPAPDQRTMESHLHLRLHRARRPRPHGRWREVARRPALARCARFLLTPWSVFKSSTLSRFRNVTSGAKGATVQALPPWGDQMGSIICGAISLEAAIS